MDHPIAVIGFTDGAHRPVYEGDDGRQYVADAAGVKVYGVWFIPRDEPEPTVIVNADVLPWTARDFPCPRPIARLLS